MIAIRTAPWHGEVSSRSVRAWYLGAWAWPALACLAMTLAAIVILPAMLRPSILHDSFSILAIVGVVSAQLAIVAGLVIERVHRRPADPTALDDGITCPECRRGLAGRLITSQEAERSRIAREIHDGVCQEMASLTVDLSFLRHRHGDIQGDEAQGLLRSLEQRAAAVAENLRLISHGLHPVVLQHVGLVAALQAYCAEIERQHHLRVTFHTDGDVEPVSDLVSLSLFRVAQEALRNAARHGHARRARLSVVRTEMDLTLSVADDGKGFNVALVRQNGGLGLVSIEERARLVHGRATFLSWPGRGTRVDVHIPLDALETARRDS